MAKMGLTELEPRCQEGCTASGGERGKFISLLFPASRALLHSSLCGTFKHHRTFPIVTERPSSSSKDLSDSNPSFNSHPTTAHMP